MSACQTLYFDAQLGLAAAKILPGEYHATGEDMVLVTKDGCRNLTDFPKIFELD